MGRNIQDGRKNNSIEGWSEISDDRAYITDVIFE